MSNVGQDWFPGCVTEQCLIKLSIMLPPLSVPTGGAAAFLIALHTERKSDREDKMGSPSASCCILETVFIENDF